MQYIVLRPRKIGDHNDRSSFRLQNQFLMVETRLGSETFISLHVNTKDTTQVTPGNTFVAHGVTPTITNSLPVQNPEEYTSTLDSSSVWI